jgi:DNA-binding response OmpR family regulator/chromosome segregation ATPase
MSLRVLVFDGDPPLASALEQALARVGCDVVSQSERSSFMAAAIAKTPDLIVFIYQPSRADAFSVCLAVRRDPSLAKVPTALVSRHDVAGEFEKHKGTKNRADVYVASATSAEALLVNLREVLPSLPLGPQSGPGIEIDEEGFDAEDDEDARTVVGKIPLDLFAKAKEPDSSNRPTLAAEDVEVEPAVVEVSEIAVVDESLIAFGTMPDSEELAAMAPPEEPAKRISAPPPMPAPVVAETNGAALEAAREKLAKLEAELLDQGSELAKARAAIEDRNREASDLRATAADHARQLEELKAKLTQAAKGQGNVSMKEFLDLREQIGKRDRELLQVREELTKKDRELIDERDRSLALERTRAEADDTITELTRAKVDAEEARAKAEAEIAQHALRVKSAETAAEEHLEALANERKRGSEAAEELATVRAERDRANEAREAAKAEMTSLAATSEAKLGELTASHEAVVAALRADVERASQELRHAESRLEERQVDLTNLGALKAATEVEVTRLREEAANLAESQEHDRKVLADLRASLETQRAAHETAMGALRAEGGAKIEALERELSDVRAAEAEVRAAHAVITAEVQALLAKLAEAEAGLVAGTQAREEAAAAAALAATQAEESLRLAISKGEELAGRALALEAEANGLRAERDGLQASLRAREEAGTRGAAHRHAGLDRARDALAVVLAELDAVPLGDGS